MSTLIISNPNPIKKQGLVDGKEITLKCSNCQAECMSFKVTRPSEDFIWRIRAGCPKDCKKADGSPEFSFPAEIRGTGRYGPAFVPHENNPDDIRMITQIVDVKEEQDSEGEIQTFYTKSI